MLEDYLSCFFDRVLEADFVKFIDSAMSFSSLKDLLHILAVAVHVDYCQPSVHANHEYIHLFPQFNTALFTDLQIL
jgi:hypothetical protein